MKDFAGFSDETEVGLPCEAGLLQVNFYKDCAAVFGHQGQMGGGINEGAGADGQEDIAGLGGADALFEDFYRQRLAEPDDIDARHAAAFGAGWQNCGVFEIATLVVVDMAAFCASVAEGVAVDFEDVSASGAFVQVVDVLGDEVEIAGALFKFGKGEMGWVRRCFEHFPSAPAIPLPDSARVSFESVRICEFRSGEVFPEAVCASESGDSALGGNPRAREDCDVFCDTQKFTNVSGFILHEFSLI